MNNRSLRTDPRVVRTRQLIKDAFVKLLQEIDMEKISVNRIAELATINRVTFYLHYRDIPDMLEKMAEEMVEEIRFIMDSKLAENLYSINDLDWSVIENLFEHVAEHANFYDLVLTTKQTSIFRERLLKYLTELIISSLEKMRHDPSLQGIPIDITVWYVSSALIGTIVGWLQNDMPYTPHFLAKQFSLLALAKQ